MAASNGSGRRYGKKSGQKVQKAMGEMKRGKLKSGRSGKKVSNPKQAIAIGLAEARKEGGKVPGKRSTSKKSKSKSGGRATAKRKSTTRKATPKRSTPKRTTKRSSTSRTRSTTRRKGRARPRSNSNR
jgi:hypothetical protein